jgi:hypothetical protein
MDRAGAVVGPLLFFVASIDLQGTFALVLIPFAADIGFECVIVSYD